MNNRNRGKNTGDDNLFGKEKEIDKLRAAVRDLFYLLSRNYPEKASSELIGNRYKLKSRQVQVIRGAAISESQFQDRMAKKLQRKDLENRTVSLDGFNVLILLESLLSEAYIFEGMDGCFRDLSGVHGTYKRVNQTSRCVDLIAEFHKKVQLKKLIWIFDKPVSNSGRIKQMITEYANENNLNWEVELQYNPDKLLAENAEIVASSDAWILDHCKNWFNLIGFLIQEEGLSANLVKIR